MNAAKLYLWDLEPAGLWRCECGSLYKTAESAEKCCKCRHCGEPAKNEWGRRLSCEHRHCRQEADRIRDLRTIEKAEVVEDYDGPVFLEGFGYQDGYFACMDELRDYLAEREDDEADLEPEEKTPRPEWAFCCKVKPVEIDADMAIERATDGFEDADDHIPKDAETKFRQAVSDFNKAIAERGFCTWDADYRRKAAVPMESEVVSS